MRISLKERWCAISGSISLSQCIRIYFQAIVRGEGFLQNSWWCSLMKGTATGTLRCEFAAEEYVEEADECAG